MTPKPAEFNENGRKKDGKKIKKKENLCIFIAS